METVFTSVTANKFESKTMQHILRHFDSKGDKYALDRQLVIFGCGYYPVLCFGFVERPMI